MDWRIYYGDGSTHSSEEGIESAPAVNVQAIAVAVPGPERGYVVHGFDYYWRDGAEWFGGEIFGLFDALVRRVNGPIFFARTIGTPEFQAVIKRATDDPLLDQ